jgi:hypothetical protein
MKAAIRLELNLVYIVSRQELNAAFNFEEKINTEKHNSGEQ